MINPIRVLQIGLGDIGLAITQILAERESYELVNAADIDPALAGSDLGQLVGLPGDREIPVHGSISEALSNTQADVAVLTTSSGMEDITPQVLELVESGLPVVSTCEELVYPWRANPDLSQRIDNTARERSVAVLSTGVNPGFLMDFLPVVLTRVARRVDAVVVERVQDAGTRREAFQRKVGAGLTVRQFEERVASGGFGHVGLTASIELLAAGLGWQLDEATETIEPVIAEQPQRTEFITVESGQVTGVYQVGKGIKGGKEVITLIFRAVAGEPEPYDRVRIEGSPVLESTFPGGVHGDVATGAITANAIPLVMQSPPGLRTMADLWPGCLGSGG
ncbi:MAG: dihydrodipicolinate reductase [Fidelibacterota bacterium]|nr:MAG: dihydrodipicolinate reductase [Candidatus Neomarinimicrobiota bacterium]